jgi:hypothetical protein
MSARSAQAATATTARSRSALGWPLLLATFLAIVGLQSIPRFLFELNAPLQIVQRAVLLALFFLVVWFFTTSSHEPFRWSILSGLFLLEAGVSVVMTILLFFQLYSIWWVYAGLFVLLLRAAAYSYVVSARLPHLRALVFGTGFFLLVIGELMLIATRLPA